MFQVNEYFTPLVKIMSESIEKKSNASLKEYGVTSGQVNILIVLSTMENQECSLKELEKIFSFSQAAIAALVVRMETKKLIVSHAVKEDRRIKYVRLTEKGSELAEIAKRKMKQLNKELLSDFSPEERRQLMENLRKIYSKLV